MEKMAWACEHSARVGVLVKTPVETHGFNLSIERARQLWGELAAAITEAEKKKEDPEFEAWWSGLESLGPFDVIRCPRGKHHGDGVSKLDARAIWEAAKKP